MSSFEHRIVESAVRLTDALEVGAEHVASACVTDICETVKQMRAERRSDAVRSSSERESRVEYDKEPGRG